MSNKTMAIRLLKTGRRHQNRIQRIRNIIIYRMRIFEYLSFCKLLDLPLTEKRVNSIHAMSCYDMVKIEDV